MVMMPILAYREFQSPIKFPVNPSRGPQSNIEKYGIELLMMSLTVFLERLIFPRSYFSVVPTPSST